MRDAVYGRVIKRAGCHARGIREVEEFPRYPYRAVITSGRERFPRGPIRWASFFSSDPLSTAVRGTADTLAVIRCVLDTPSKNVPIAWNVCGRFTPNCSRFSQRCCTRWWVSIAKPSPGDIRTGLDISVRA